MVLVQDAAPVTVPKQAIGLHSHHIDGDHDGARLYYRLAPTKAADGVQQLGSIYVRFERDSFRENGRCNGVPGASSSRVQSIEPGRLLDAAFTHQGRLPAMEYHSLS